MNQNVKWWHWLMAGGATLAFCAFQWFWWFNPQFLPTPDAPRGARAPMRVAPKELRESETITTATHSKKEPVRATAGGPNS
jgi:hypothetical protein